MKQLANMTTIRIAITMPNPILAEVYFVAHPSRTVIHFSLVTCLILSAGFLGISISLAYKYSPLSSTLNALESPMAYFLYPVKSNTT